MIQFNSIEEVQREVIKYNYFIDTIYEQTMMHINLKYKTFAFILWLIMILAIIAMIFNIIQLNIIIISFISISWVITWAFYSICKSSDYSYILNEYKCAKVKMASDLFQSYCEFNNMSGEERNKIFESDIAPYANLQKVKDADNRSGNG